MAVGRPSAWPTIWAFCVAGEIRDVKRDRCPEADHAGDGGDKEREEFAVAFEFAGFGKDGAETAGFARDPPQQEQADGEHERRGDTFQNFNGFDAAHDDEHVERPEGEKTNPLAGGELRPGRGDNLQHGVDGGAADPGLDAEPAASDEGAQNGGNVCAAHAERSAHEDRKRNAIPRTGMSVEQHGNEDDEIA
jgi:hypothetical protein